MDKIMIVDGKKYKKIEEHEEQSCCGCVLLGTGAGCDSDDCIYEGIILEKIEGEDYE